MIYVPAIELQGPSTDEDIISLGHPNTVVEDLQWSEFLKGQWEAFAWESSGPFARINLLGGWGSGKTHGGARLALKYAARNPWTPVYRNNNPTGIIVAPTFRILKQSTMQQFDQVVPRSAIKKRRGPPHNDIMMANGFRWVLYSGEGEIEGLNACVFWVDEIQHPVFSGDGRRFLNLMARIRDQHSPNMCAITTGLPESGWVRDTFDKGDAADMLTVLCATKDNPNIPEATLQAFYDSCPSGQEEMLLEGRWMSPIGAIYPQYDASIHVVNKVGDTRLPTHIGMDIGNYGAVVLAQEQLVTCKTITGHSQTHRGLHVVDQMVLTDASVETMCYKIKTTTPWEIVPGRSTICVDPTIRRDEVLAIQKHFPGVQIVKRDRGHETFPVEAGIRQVQRGLRDALGNVRLTFAPGLRGKQHGVLDFLQRYRRNDRGEPVKDNLRDHVGDALRYLVCELIPTDKPVTRVL